MQTKVFEVRDRGTFICIMATATEAKNENENYILNRSAFNSGHLIVTTLHNMETQYSSHNWGTSRTMREAHKHLCFKWDELESGQVIDIEYILGETKTPKLSERLG